MANRVNVEITANTSGYKNAIDEAKGANKQFQSSIEDIDIKGLNREFRSAQKTAQGLALELNRMQKAGKVDTAQYRALQREFIEVKKHAADLKDVVGDTQEEIKHMASDTRAWDAFKEGISVARDSMTALAAATGTEEQMKDVLMQIARIQTVANAAISIGNALQKQSALMSGIRAIQEAALAKAIDMETAATGRATIAQKLFNTVAKANPYVLLASAIIAVGTAIGAYVIATKNATDADSARQKALQAVKDTQEQYNSTFTQSASQSISSYRKLQAEWNALKTAHEKNQWIKNNKSEFEKLGLSVTDTASAENVFVSNSNSVVEGLIKRARAAAAAAQAQQLYQKALEKSIETEALKAEYADKMAKARGTSDTQIKDQFGNTIGTVKGKTVEEQRSELMDELMNKMVDLKLEQQELYAEGDKLIRQSVELGGIDTSSKSGGSGGSTSNTKKDIEYAQYSLTALEAGLSDLQKKYKDGLLPNLSKDDYLKQVDELQTQIENKKIELGIELPLDEIAQIDKKINNLKTKQLRVETRLSREQYIAELKRLEEEKQQIKIDLGLEVEPSAFAKLSQTISDKLAAYNIPVNLEAEPSKLDKLKKELEQYTYLQEHVELSEVDLAEVKAKIKKLKSDIESEEIQVGVSNTVTNKVVESKEEEKQDLQNKVTNIINDTGGIPEPDTSVYSEMIDYLTQIRDLEQEISDIQDPLAEKERKQLKTQQEKVQALQGIGGAISGLGSAMSQLADKEDKGVQVAALIAQAIGSVLAGAGTAIAQSASMGPWAYLAFSVAAMTTAATTIAQIKNLGASAKYAHGGFIGGNSFYGDTVPILANSGEAVLNPEQQRRFMQIADGAVSTRNAGNRGLEVTSIGVSGSDLILTINNTLKENGQPTIG